MPPRRYRNKAHDLKARCPNINLKIQGLNHSSESHNRDPVRSLEAAQFIDRLADSKKYNVIKK